MLNQPISPAERLFEESTRVPYFSAQLALLTARPPEQNPRLAQGCVTFWAEHDRGPDVEADLVHLWPVTCSNKSGNASGSNGSLARLARLEIKFSKLKEVSIL